MSLHKVSNGFYLGGTAGFANNKKVGSSFGILRRSSETILSPSFPLWRE
jgi:hypothetical protein